MREAVGLCPWSKRLYATHATALPDAYLVLMAAGRHREALAGARAELVQRRRSPRGRRSRWAAGCSPATPAELYRPEG
jgi:hypothetical protein